MTTMTGLPECMFLLFMCALSNANFNVNLNGNWTLSNNLRGYSVKATVPGNIYTALFVSGITQNPLYRDNDVKYQWIGREDWIYSRTFSLDSSQISTGSVILVCDGLDTISTITVNDQLVGTSDNMFVKYTYDIKRFVRAGINSITIHFRSAVNVAKERAVNSSYVVPPKCPNFVQHGECHVNMIRKEQCSFSWDWGPSFPTQGIWKNIYIRGLNTAVIKDLSATVHRAGHTWSVNVTAYFDVAGRGQVGGSLVGQLDGTSVSKTQPISLTQNSNSFSFILHIPPSFIIDEWWPNGYGNQTLYGLSVTFRSGTELSHSTIRIGFRTVELVQQAVSSTDRSKGLTFYYKINGIPVFFKGSNWIPADSFQETITKERLRRLLQSAADVHINSMRVWGGGVFESEDFYDLTDELGIMIWQDFMFSDAMYPVDAAFIQSVKEEVTYQVRRLKHRPSVVVWAGNNENESVLRGNVFNTDVNYTRYYDDYIKLYIDTVRPIVLSEDSTREYLSSSPSDGVETDKERWVAKNPGDEHYGDIHYYNYLGDLYNDSKLPIPRFSSEFGVQAWCDLDTLGDVMEEGDFDYWGNMAAHRQHHSFGQVEMMTEVIQHMNLPDTEDTKQKFKDLIYLTQINQAESIRMESEHYRRWQTDLTPDGRGLTMGALYWQLNDIWQAPSWSSIDYQGKWKMLHYFAKKFFAPILISPFNKNGDLNVYVVIDELPIVEMRDQTTGNLGFQPDSTFIQILHSEFPRTEVVHLMSKLAAATAGKLVIQMFSWDNFTPLKTWTIQYKLYKSAERVFNRSMADMMREAGCVYAQHCFFYLYKEDDSRLSAWLPLSYMKNAKGLSKAQISITRVAQTSPTTFEITLSSNRIAPYVWLDANKVKGRFSDNGFLMTKPQTFVTYTSWEAVDLTRLKLSLTVRSLLDVYTHLT